jgi:hypothetical protein
MMARRVLTSVLTPGGKAMTILFPLPPGKVARRKPVPLLSG